MVDLGTLGGGTYTQPADVNDAGQVVGVSGTAAGEGHAFSWTQAGGMVDLGTVSGTESSATSVNVAGQVVGYGFTADWNEYAFSWTEGDGIAGLSTLPGGYNSVAWALNDAGQAVGSSDTASGETHAVLWQLPSTFHYSTDPCLGQPGHAVLQPVNPDTSSVFKRGSTVPVKFRVCDASGNSVGPTSVFDPTKGAAPVLYTKTNGVGGVDEQVFSTTPDTSFRWDPTAQQWIFNQSTKNLLSGITYTYRIYLNDGTYIEYTFGVK
jgi:probable HAF family extracellular repeat protein